MNAPSAFPTPEYYDEKCIGSSAGMTLRDYFAAHALAMLAPFDVEAAVIAKHAYRIADAMLVEREKGDMNVEAPNSHARTDRH